MTITDKIILTVSIILLVWAAYKLGYKHGLHDGWYKAFRKMQEEVRSGKDIVCSFTYRWLYTYRGIRKHEVITNVKYDQKQLNEMLSEYGKDKLNDDIRRTIHEREYGEEYEAL